MDAKHLATILAEEFERDRWGDVDPYWFRAVVEEDMECEYARDLRKVMERVAERINNERQDGPGRPNEVLREWVDGSDSPTDNPGNRKT